METSEADVQRVLARLDAGEVLDADEVRAAFAIDDAFAVDNLGITWGAFSAERVTAHLDLGERHHQPYGIVHGGVWCTVVETLGSVAAWLRVASRGQVVVGVANSTDFLRAHRTGRVEAVAQPLHVGRTQQLWEVVMRRADDGKAVARGQVRLQTVDPARIRG